MGRVLNIITRARDTLADKLPKKYTTDRMLRVLSEGQAKVARETLCLRYTGTIQLCDGYHTYKLNSALIEPLGGLPLALFKLVNHAGKDCIFITERQAGELDSEWRTTKGDDVTHIVYDHREPLVFRVYPIPDSTKLVAPISFNTTNEPLADAAVISEPIAVQSNFDITSETTPVKLLVKFYHTPPDIVTVEDTNLLTSEHFDLALKHYVTGMVLRDDTDAQNRAYGAEEMKIFYEQFAIAKALTSASFIDQRLETYSTVGYETVI